MLRILPLGLMISGAVILVGAANGQTGGQTEVKAAQPKVELMSGAVKKTGKTYYFTGAATINNRIDSNAILNLDSHPIEQEVAAVAPEATVAAPVAAVPTAKERLIAANAKLKVAKKAYTDAVHARSKAQIAQAKTDLNAAKQEVKQIKAEIRGAKSTTPKAVKAKADAAK